MVILCVKKSIFNAKLKDNSPTLAQVKANVMFVYKYDEHKAIIRNKEYVFEKDWGMFTNYLRQ